jgi:sugar phosphate isomerase/epimerase
MKAFEIGVMINNLEPDRLRAFAVAAREGFRVVHTSGIPEAWLIGPDRDRYVTAARESGLEIAALFIGFDGQSYANLGAVARTVGLVIPQLQEHRCGVARLYSDLARDLRVGALAMHLGFLPASTNAQFHELVQSLRGILGSFAANGQTLHLETGQETGRELKDIIEAVDRPNLGVNFDGANFVLYGTDEPLAALECLAPYVRGVHCKDGISSQHPGELGKEVRIGQGEVPFPQMIHKLREVGYSGPLIIEREHGPQVREDIHDARAYLGELLRRV